MVNDARQREDPLLRMEAVGWGLGLRQLEINSLHYVTLTWHLDVLPCVPCERLMVGVPLLLCPAEGEWLLSFCWSCAKQWGIPKAMDHAEGRKGKRNAKGVL
jgi:hypothetical protein